MRNKNKDINSSLKNTLGTSLLIAFLIITLSIVYLMTKNYANMVKQAYGQLDPYDFKLDLSSKMIGSMGEVGFNVLFYSLMGISILPFLVLGILSLVLSDTPKKKKTIGLISIISCALCLLFGIFVQVCFEDWVFSLCIMGIAACVAVISLLYYLPSSN